MASFNTDKNVLPKHFTLTAGLVLLCKGNAIDSFRVARRETLPTGLLNSCKEQEAHAINVRMDLNEAHLFVREKFPVQNHRQQEVCDV
jgi:hypothetical protein